MFRLDTLKSLTLGAVLASSIALGGAGLALAQDEQAQPDVSHPAHVHAGTCDELDPNPIQPLDNIEPKLNESDDENANEPQGVLLAQRVLYSETDVDMSLDDMLASPFSINAHESDENIQNYIACGEIGGVVVDDKLAIALRPVNDSGYTGIAILEKDGDKTNIKVYLAEPVSPENVATPVA
jgi:hypothetical protein